MRNILVTLLLVFIVLTGCRVGEDNYALCSDEHRAATLPAVKSSAGRNVILCIGDGMGAAQVAAARITAGGLDGSLVMEKMPYAGLMRTHSGDSSVTDSAAAATALATGIKTNNGMVSVTPDGKKCVTILEAARDKGMATGLVCTCSVTHATPAGFAAHVRHRKMEDEIAEQLLDSRVNVLLGGGRKFFLPECDAASGRQDGRNLINAAIKDGYEYVENGGQLKRADGKYVLGLFACGPLTNEPAEPNLVELTAKAIELLDRDSGGFFLMVEASQIDWDCHANDIDGCIEKVLVFDKAVKKALDFALSDRQTVVIVTADHETGGLTLHSAEDNKLRVAFKWSTKGHSGAAVPVYAFGPGAQVFSGVSDNTDIARKIAGLLGIKEFPKVLE
ncbi:MAG TPA: alkaline phosphatase [Sedimentisphaerales bacterium]|nr:alkaline phosphatase [Sedimentisphaerales bacterium]